jgi:hypothetical protein
MQRIVPLSPTALLASLAVAVGQIDTPREREYDLAPAGRGAGEGA